MTAIFVSLITMWAVVGIMLFMSNKENRAIRSGKSRRAISKGRKDLMVTTGRFKGKYLLDPYDQEEIEREVFQNPVEALIASINAKSSIDGNYGGSELACATIERIDLELDPFCKCSAYNKHRVSGHASYIATEKSKREAELQYNLTKAKMVAKKNYEDASDIWTTSRERASMRKKSIDYYSANFYNYNE